MKHLNWQRLTSGFPTWNPNVFIMLTAFGRLKKRQPEVLLGLVRRNDSVAKRGYKKNRGNRGQSPTRFGPRRSSSGVNRREQ